MYMYSNVVNTAYSKMPKNTIFFFAYNVNWPSLPRFKPKILLNSADATR